MARAGQNIFKMCTTFVARLWSSATEEELVKTRNRKRLLAIESLMTAANQMKNQISVLSSNKLAADCFIESPSSSPLFTLSSPQPQSICDLSLPSFSSVSPLHSSSPASSSNRKRTRTLPSFFALIFTFLSLTNTVSASGFFELQVLDGVHNSTTVHVCLKEFWNSQINFNRCTFGQKTVIFNSNSNNLNNNNDNNNNDLQQQQQQHHHHRRQSTVKVPFSFRWIVSAKCSPYYLLFLL